MKCPKCDGGTKVVDRRENRRRRECLLCKHRFSTLEVLPDAVAKKVEPVIENVRAEKPKAPPKIAPKRTNPITVSAVKRNADARRKIEELRDSRNNFDYLDPDYDYLPDKW
jgi:transcriptional regulator NrdR family protein